MITKWVALVVIALSVIYLAGYEITRYLVWWRFHTRFAWWKTLREEWHRIN